MYDDLQIGCLFWNLFRNAKSGQRSCHPNLNTQGSWASRRLRHCPNSGEQGQRLAWQLFGLFPGLPGAPSVWKASISEGRTLRREVRTKTHCKVTEGPVLYSIVTCMVIAGWFLWIPRNPFSPSQGRANISGQRYRHSHYDCHENLLSGWKSFQSWLPTGLEVMVSDNLELDQTSSWNQLWNAQTLWNQRLNALIEKLTIYRTGDGS